MQPYFFPYIGYFHGISASDKYILNDNFNYIRKGWVNRNKYLVSYADPTYMRAEVVNGKPSEKIKDVKLLVNSNWRDKILKSIYLNYKKASFFDEVYSLVEEVLTYKTEYLSDLNKKSIIKCCDYLGIKTEIVTDVKKFDELEMLLESIDNDSDLSTLFPSVDCRGLDRKTIRNIRFCQIENASIYVNAIGGKDIYKKDSFIRNNIELFFVESSILPYQQLSGRFHPNLSIIDVMMNCGKDKTNALLKDFTLI